MRTQMSGFAMCLLLMADVLHELFVPYTPDELRSHFVHSDLDSEDPERHLKAWRGRITDVAAKASKDPAFLYRDETMWTAGGLLALQRSKDHRAGGARCSPSCSEPSLRRLNASSGRTSSSPIYSFTLRPGFRRRRVTARARSASR